MNCPGNNWGQGVFRANPVSETEIDADTDCIEGTAVATITNFQAAVVPEPGVIALLGSACSRAALPVRAGRRALLPEPTAGRSRRRPDQGGTFKATRP